VLKQICVYILDAEPVVLFSVGLSKNTTTQGRLPVLYDTVFSNIGDGFDLTTGTFRAPVDGLYQFTFYGMSNSETTLDLVHNSMYVPLFF